MGEFDLIQRFFQRPNTQVNLDTLGIGDDCALLRLAPDMQLAVSTDMLVEGRHFLSTVDPRALGHKALAVNLSDLAACGAKPIAFTLALALPRVDEGWLEAFSQGLFALADTHGCALIGGDTTQGPLNICISIFGEVPRGQALLRSGAKAGDDIYTSGTLGDARLALEVFRGRHMLEGALLDAVRIRMEQPSPRVALGLALRGIASAAIDVSDGLIGDLAHVLAASRVGACIDAAQALESAAISVHLKTLDEALQLEYLLSGGDDYELVFTAPFNQRNAVQAAALRARTAVTRIGTVQAQQGLRLLGRDGVPLQQQFKSFDHFA